MVNNRVDTTNLPCIGLTTAGGSIYYNESLDVTIVDYKDKGQRVFFDRKFNFSNEPFNFSKVRFFGVAGLQDGFTDKLE